MNNNTFKVINELGEEIICDVLFTFDSEDNGKSYIVYTDNTLDANGNVNVMAAIYDPTHQDPKLESIETEEEWKMIETILAQLQEETKKRLEEKQKHADELYIRLHVFENQKSFLDNVDNYKKLGVVDIIGKKGQLTLGSHMLNHICFQNGISVSAVELMFGIVDRKFVVSSVSGRFENYLNHKRMSHIDSYLLNHGDEITIDKSLKIYIEIFNKTEMKLDVCSICGKPYLGTMEEECCFDCRYEMNKELDFEIEKDLKEINLLEYQNEQPSDILIKVVPEDKEHPRIFKGIV